MADANLESATTDVSREKLLADLKVVVRDAEALMKATAQDLGEKAQEAREKLGIALQRARETSRQLQTKAIQQAREGDRVIRAHPYEAIGVAFCVGLLIGVMINRR